MLSKLKRVTSRDTYMLLDMAPFLVRCAKCDKFRTLVTTYSISVYKYLFRRREIPFDF